MIVVVSPPSNTRVADTKEAEFLGKPVENLECSGSKCSGWFRVETATEERLKAAAAGMQWSFAKESDAARAGLIASGPNASTWVRCTRAESKAAGSDTEKLQDECDVRWRSAQIDPTAEIAGQTSPFDRPTEREAPKLIAALQKIPGLTDDPDRLSRWSVDECRTVGDEPITEASKIRSTLLRCDPYSGPQWNAAGAARVMSVMRSTYRN